MAATESAAYSTSHPWISFRIDLSRASPDFWMLLGESRSKLEHLIGAFLSPSVKNEMNRMYLAKGVHATTAIEGNSLSEEQVGQVVDGTLSLPPSQEYLAQEIRNILKASNTIKDYLISGGVPDLEVEDIMHFNRMALEDLELDAGVVPGEFRKHRVVVGRYRAVEPADCEQLLARLCDWLRSSDFEPPGAEWRTPYALIKAAIAHLYLAWIHPFGDGNGRTARLVELEILLGAGFPIAAAHLMSNHYNETRTEYYRQLDNASRSGGDVMPFLQYAVRGFVDGIREQLAHAKAQQFEDRWEQYVYETFGDVRTAARERQRRMVLELSKRNEPVPRYLIPQLTPQLAVAYHGTECMLSRDINAARSLGLIERVPAGWRARKEQIQAFQPLRRAEAPFTESF